MLYYKRQSAEADVKIKLFYNKPEIKGILQNCKKQKLKAILIIIFLFYKNSFSQKPYLVITGYEFIIFKSINKHNLKILTCQYQEMQL